MARHHVRSLTDASTRRAGRSRERRRAEKPNARWLQPPRGRAPRKPQGAILGGNLGKKGAQSPAERSEQEQRTHHIDRRRLGPGKATSCHDGGVEAVLATLAESVKQHAPPRKGAHRYRAKVATGVSEVRSTGEWVEEHAPTIPGRSAEAMRSVVKRSHPRSRWAATQRVTPSEELVTLSREQTGYGCS